MRYFFSDASCPLTYLSSGNLNSRDDFLHHRRTIPSHVLIMVKEGQLFLSQNGIDHIIGPGHFIFLPADEEHFGYQASTGKLSYLWVHFLFNCEIATQTKLPSDLFSSGHYVIPEWGSIAASKRASLLFNQLLDLSRQDVIYSTQMLDYALSLLVLEISRELLDAQNNSSANMSAPVLHIMEWIKGNYYRPITVSEIAAEFGYNPHYLSSLFQKSTGTSISGYITKTRIDIAKSMLVNYDVPLKEVAYTCGFSDEKYFMKVFKKLEGITPSQYKTAFHRKLYN